MEGSCWTLSGHYHLCDVLYSAICPKTLKNLKSFKKETAFKPCYIATIVILLYSLDPTILERKN